MSIGAPARLEPSASRQVEMLIRQRDALRPAYDGAHAHLAHTRMADEMEAWLVAVLALVHANAGTSCLLAFWTVSRDLPSGEPMATLLDAATATTSICRHAGARAATACLTASPIARQILTTPAAIARWWRALARFAAEAPESVEPIAQATGIFLAAGDVAAFETVLSAGLKHAAGDRRKRHAFFTLDDPAARRILNRASAQIGFAEAERATKAFVTALWGRPPSLRALAVGDSHAPQRRASIAGPLIRLPDIYRGISDEAVPLIYRAAAAHAQAHLMLGGPRFVVGQLKPLQIALVTLIEDARIETLAMRQFPGLRRLWSPYHVALPSGVATAPALMARLARALFDPSFADDDGFIAKGRAMVDAAADRLDDPAISREIGMLLGNDLGQMRVQFNAKTYVVEPVYRDDGMGLWDFGETADPAGDVLDIHTDAARIERKEQSDSPSGEPQQDQQPSAIGHAKLTAADRRGTVIATYPEWDRAQGVARPDWTTVRDVAAAAGDPAAIDDALTKADALRRRIARLVGSVRVGRTTRLKRQIDGYDLDIDAMLDAGIALATQQQPDPRIFRATAAQQRDLAVLVLIDVSESTRDRLAGGPSVLDVERLAVAVLAEAIAKLGDPFCLMAFASNGRDDVNLTTVKSFAEPYDRASRARLAGLTSGLSTRLGAALRHAGATIGAARSFRKVVIVLTDGEPSDIDVADPQELIEDARRAALGLKTKGIDGFGVVLDAGGMSAAARMFGRGNTMLVHRIEDLPARLSEVYFRLARR